MFAPEITGSLFSQNSPGEVPSIRIDCRLKQCKITRYLLRLLGICALQSAQQSQKYKIAKTYLVKYFHLHLQLDCFWRKVRLTVGKHLILRASSISESVSCGVKSCCGLSFSEVEFIGLRERGAKC